MASKEELDRFDSDAERRIKAVKRQNRRFVLACLAAAFVGAFLLDIALLLLLEHRIAHHLWTPINLDRTTNRIVGKLFFIATMSIAALVISRRQNKMIGPELIAAKKTELKQQRDDERQAVGWTVPRAAQAADTRKAIVFTLILSVVTFVAVIIILGVFLLVERARSPAGHVPEEPNLVWTALECASVVGVSIPLMWGFLLLFAHEKLMLTREGLVKRLGRTRHVTRYEAIQEVRIEPSRKVPALECMAFKAEGRFGVTWTRYTFGKDAPINEVIRMLATHGIIVNGEPPATIERE